MGRSGIFILFLAGFLSLRVNAQTDTTGIDVNDPRYYVQETGKKKKKKDTDNGKGNVYRTWFMEVSYLMIPSSFTSGAEMHFEVPAKVKKKTAVKPAFGFGGGFFQHLYKKYDYGEYQADVLTRRFTGHATVGIRVVNKLGGVCARVGYNFMYMQYEWKRFYAITDAYGTLRDNQIFHRIQYEIVGFKSFTKKKPGVGILVGAQYLHDPFHKDSDLFLVKAGIAF